MRILTGIDVPFQPCGGSLLVCDNWYSDLPAGVEVRFLALPPPPGIRKWWRMKDVVLLEVEKTRTAEAFPQYIEELTSLVRRQIDDFKPDVIHCQHLNYGLSRVFANLKTNVPRLGICHGTDAQAAVNSSFFADNLRIICDAMDELVFPNHTMADDCLKIYGKPKKYVINPLGVPDRYFRKTVAAPSYTRKRPLQVLYAGRLLHWKGADVAIRTLPLMKHKAQLTIIGNEDQIGYASELAQYVQEYDLVARVTFKPQMPRERLLEVFHEYDVMVFPSKGLEAFSLTVVEAQLSGLPVVVAPGGGIVDTVGDGGLILPDHNPQSLALALDSIADRPALLQELQSKGLKNAGRYRLSASRTRLFDLSRKMLSR